MKKSQAKIGSLDNYIELYYDEGIDQKIEASKKILSLFQNFRNLKVLLQHESLLQVLSRTIIEHHHHNIDLCVHTLSIFYILSNYRQLQQLIKEQHIGKIIIDIMNNQIQRFDLLYSEYIELWRNNAEKDKLTAKKQLKKLNILIWKQDKLFFICLNILLNISDDPVNLKKMLKVSLIQILTRCLQRNDFHLLIVTLVFMKKLSIIAEYKDQMIKANVNEELKRFFSCENQILLKFSLFVYYNLGFDRAGRQKIERSYVIPKLVSLLENQNSNRILALNIIYLLSIDKNIRSTIGFTQCLSIVVRLLLRKSKDTVGAVQLYALAINLVNESSNASQIQPEDFHQLLLQACAREDPTIMKLCKIIVKNTNKQQIHDLMGQMVKDKLIKLVMANNNKQQLQLEILGVMSYICIGKEWTDIMIGHDKFVQMLGRNMVSGLIEEDILLQTIILISNICRQPECCALIEQLFQPILSLFLQKQYDDQFTIQLLFAIYSFIFHGIGLQLLLSQSQVLIRMLESIEHPNSEIRNMNDEVLTILRQTDDIELIQNIKESKFNQHNKKWLNQTEAIYEMMYNENDYAFAQNALDPRMWEDQDDYD